MAAAALVARLVLAAVFAVAGAAKLADRDDARRTLGGFGVPAALVAPLALLILVAELATAGALLAAPTIVAGALGAIGLLVAFSAAIAIAIVRGRQVECGCFGRLYAAMVSRRTLARNGVLLAIAVFVLASAPSVPATSATAWVAGLSGWQAAALVQVALCWQLLRQNGRLWRAVRELERRLTTEASA